MKIKVLGRIITLSISQLPDNKAVGVSNRTVDNMHCIFLDYDGVDWHVIQKDLDYLVAQGCSNFHVFTSNDYQTNRHCVSFTKLPNWALLELLTHLHCDPKYMEMPRKVAHRANVLRVLPKERGGGTIRYDRTYPVEPVNMHREMSTAHQKFYQQMFSIPDLPYMNPDNHGCVEVHKYVTF